MCPPSLKTCSCVIAQFKMVSAGSSSNDRQKLTMIPCANFLFSARSLFGVCKSKYFFDIISKVGFADAKCSMKCNLASLVTSITEESRRVTAFQSEGCLKATMPVTHDHRCGKCGEDSQWIEFHFTAGRILSNTDSPNT